MTPFHAMTLFDTVGFIDNLKEFRPCLPSESISYGWVPAFDGHFYLNVSGSRFMLFRIETKALPADGIKRLAREFAGIPEGATPTKAQRALLAITTQQVVEQALPTTMATRQDIGVWFDKDRLAINSISPDKCATVLSALPELTATPIKYHTDPAAMLVNWVENGSDDWFTVEPECRFANKEGSSLTYLNLEFNSLLPGDLTPRKLGLTFNDALTFVFRDDGKLTKIKMIEEEHEDEADELTNLELMVGTYRQLISALTKDNQL